MENVPLPTGGSYGHILRARSLIGQTTRRILDRGSVIETGNPELTTGGRAEIGALIGGSKGTGNPPPNYRELVGYRRETRRSRHLYSGAHYPAKLGSTDRKRREPGG